ncbi:rhamnogalacturonan lyase family protein [Tellurirhabdus bombi]|uniref:rhamnogalacturonan lyase family protein n=1 Tax=Tellurirhabdus bombi TaxID=2907205 RepID=UPI00272E2C4D|nr:T9SS type A sorting domain-containing protein [Tellurirhabdus bombi]
MKRQLLFALFLGLLCVTSRLHAQRKMEMLGRGVVAVRTSPDQVYVGWRLLATDPANVAFNVYRGATKLNATPITQSTNYTDQTVVEGQYSVRPVVNGVEQAGSALAKAWATNILRIPLKVPAPGPNYTYSPNDASVGDLDGDGEYEIILKWDPSNAQDNSLAGVTGNVYLDAYRLDGTFLWRIDLGRNIRAGAHYTQFMVYDLDSDGKAEIACKTADGTIDGKGKVIGNADADYRNASGYILAGPEYLTVFNGQTGAEITTVGYLPQRHPTAGDNPTPNQIREVWGDNYGNRMDRFLACIAYLDGVHPSLVMTRGYYTGQSGIRGRTYLAAWDFKNGQLAHRWSFDTYQNPANDAYNGQGNHNLSVGDVDGDGKDEIIYGACAIDDNGQGLYTTGLGHGDALHMSDMDPDRPGLEVYQPHETPSLYGPNAFDLRDARTGQLIFGGPGPNSGDNGRGMAADIDPRHKGYEVWSSRGGLYTIKGEQISTSKPSINFGLWWDGDLSRELLDGTSIDKWNYNTSRSERLVTGTTFGAERNNTTKANPCLSADLFGDWREEVIWRNANNSELIITTTTIPTAENTPRIYSLMQDPQYRLSVAWQNVAYNQPPHPGFYLGTDMAAPPVRNAETITRPLQLEPPTYDCATGKIIFRYSGGNGTLVEFLGDGMRSFTSEAEYYIAPGSTKTYGLVLRQKVGNRYVTYKGQIQIPACNQNARVASSKAELSAGLTAVVYPNPVSEEFSVTIGGVQGQAVRMQLTDINGLPIVVKTIEAKTNQHTEQVKLGQRPSGIYLLRVSTAKEVKTLKLIKP